MRRSRRNASISRKTLRKPPGGSASSTRCGKSRSFVRPTISRLRRVISPNPLRLSASLLGDRYPDPVIREKSQFRAQHDSLSLSPARDGTSLCLNFRPLAALFFWAAFFRPCVHAGGEMVCRSFAPVFFLFALHGRRILAILTGRTLVLLFFISPLSRAPVLPALPRASSALSL